MSWDELLWSAVWWRFDPSAGWTTWLYSGFNTIEGMVWCGLACFTLARWRRRRRSPWEILYSAAFLVFGLTDFYEARELTSWLLWVKAATLAALAVLRWHALRLYPESRGWV